MGLLRSSSLLCGAVIGALLTTAAPAAAASALKCQTGYQWYKKGPSIQKRTEQTQRNENVRGRVAEATFTSRKAREVSKQVTISTEAEASGGFGPISASIKAAYGVTTSESQTTEIGNDFTVKVPPRRAVEASYGVFRRKFTGVYGRQLKQGEVPPLVAVAPPRNCSNLGFFDVKATLPIGIGWRSRVKKLNQ